MKMGRSSVSDRGSSKRNGLLTGEMKLSKQWSLWNQARPPDGVSAPKAPSNHPPLFGGGNGGGFSATTPALYCSLGGPGTWLGGPSQVVWLDADEAGGYQADEPVGPDGDEPVGPDGIG